MQFLRAMRLASFVLVTLAGSAASAAPPFTIVERAPAELDLLTPGPRPASGVVARVDRDALDALLAAAPAEDLARRLRDYGTVLVLPMPDGTLSRFAVADSPIMAPALAANYPWMRTFIVQGLDDTSMVGRVDLTQRGFHALVRTTRGAVFIDPYAGGATSHVVSYYLHDLPGGNDWKCETHDEAPGRPPLALGPDQVEPQVAVTLRTYTLAMACTGEYGVHQSQVQGHAPNREDPLAAIVTVVNRTTAVYEVDIACRFQLVANNDLIVYFNPGTDPYPDSCDGTGGADCSGPYLSPNITNLATVIGDANFDVGHLLTRVYGGVAYLSSVCSSGKAGGISGIPRGGDVDPFAALLVMHEMGHQFGANHSFNGIQGRCAGNFAPSQAWEPGSGSSPMSYAGACPVGDAPPSDNITQFFDPWFHHASIAIMKAFAAAGGNPCATQSVTANNPPVLTWPQTGVTFNIPPLTPFELTAQATDPDGDALTYSWEQFDVGPAQSLFGPGSADNGLSPIFRIFPPTASPTRTFPRMADILSGTPTPGEKLPSVQPSKRRLVVAVRDNRAGGGGLSIGPTPTGTAFVNISLPAGVTPFGVVQPAENDQIAPGETTVRWTVGGTQSPPINVAAVTIRLSTDAGQTFPTVLGSGIANDGEATIVIPAGSAGPARLKIEAEGNIFFCVSRPFVVRSACGDADFNGDSQIDFFDYLDFTAALDHEDPRADFDHNGSLDFFDYLDFVVAYDQGC